MNPLIHQKLSLNDNTFLLDAGLEEATIQEEPYVFHDLPTVLKAANAHGQTGEGPVTIYIAPGVYWIDDPDAMEIVCRAEGYDAPYGMVVNCTSLRLTGLTENPGHVVLAGNRGQSHGARGNYTLFLFRVQNLEMSNLTLGNYCNVDLDYLPNPSLSHRRRTDTITQAQLAKQSGDTLLARNCRFVSRLNLCPVVGGRRCLYERCHFESTDDALNGRAVYVNCDFDFYGGRPLYSTAGSGAAFLGCLFRSKKTSADSEHRQYFTKEGGPVTVVDCGYQGNPAGLSWTKYPQPSLKCYQYHFTSAEHMTEAKNCAEKPTGFQRTPFCNEGTAITIGGMGAPETVSMEGKELLNAYRLETEVGIVYNTYNLLKGKDGWDPLEMKKFALQKGKDQIPTLLTLEASSKELISGETKVILQAQAFYFYGEPAENVQISCFVTEKDMAYVRLTDQGKGRWLAEGTNTGQEQRMVLIHASTPEGLESAVELLIWPPLKEAPVLSKMPVLEWTKSESCRVCYQTEPEGEEDQSQISWYRCEDAAGCNPILVAVSRGESPLTEYSLSEGDEGYYLMSKIIPRHSCSRPGRAVRVISDRPVPKITRRQVFSTDFSTLPTVIQKKILPGFWTVDSLRPMDTADFDKWLEDQDSDPWQYGRTGNGCIGYGLYQNVQGARLLYTPAEGTYGDMTLKLKMDPAKTAGQGFGSAGQYMDLCIKFDTKTLTGYGLRIIRTKEASDGVRFILIQYDHGKVHDLNDGIMTSCYRTGCEVTLSACGTLLTAHGESDSLSSQSMPALEPSKRTLERPQSAQTSERKYPHAPIVNLSARIETNPFGGIAVWHTGTPGTGGWQNTTMLHDLEVRSEFLTDYCSRRDQ